MLPPCLASHETLQLELNYKVNGLSPIHMAANRANIELTQSLIEYGVDFTKISDNGDTHLLLVILYFNYHRLFHQNDIII